jgi:hypothetical protein
MSSQLAILITNNVSHHAVWQIVSKNLPVHYLLVSLYFIAAFTEKNFPRHLIHILEKYFAIRCSNFAYRSNRSAPQSSSKPCK